MKKLDNKILKEKVEEQQHFDFPADTTISCDCCSELPPVATREEGEEDELGDEEHGDNKKKKLLNDKLLIIIGLGLTIPIVVLESVLPHSLSTGFVTLALATPAQILLGRPFYSRFFQAVLHRKRFTTDTLVVLSTTVA